MFDRSVHFCRACGTAVKHRVPDDGDTKERAVCPQCDTVHYINPLLVVGTLPVYHDGRVLLCKRAIEPRKGFWTLPAGFMEMDETTAEGAARETHEEAGADISLGALFSLINVARVGQVHLFYLADLQSDCFAPGPESWEVALFKQDAIPWDDIAFPTVRMTLERYFEDAARGAMGFHALDWRSSKPARKP
jgi:ADP-ribose pyrophosphatase YjhB (NUDIX family)